MNKLPCDQQEFGWAGNQASVKTRHVTEKAQVSNTRPKNKEYK